MTEHLSLEVSLNPHGVTVYPALRTQSELRRGRRHEPTVRYSQNPQGQWVRGFESLRALVADAELTLPLATAPAAEPLTAAEPRSKAYRDAVHRARPSSFRKMVRNEQGDWEPEAA